MMTRSPFAFANGWDGVEELAAVDPDSVENADAVDDSDAEVDGVLA